MIDSLKIYSLLLFKCNIQLRGSKTTCRHISMEIEFIFVYGERVKEALVTHGKRQ